MRACVCEGRRAKEQERARVSERVCSGKRENKKDRRPGAASSKRQAAPSHGGRVSLYIFCPNISKDKPDKLWNIFYHLLECYMTQNALLADGDILKICSFSYQ